VRLRPGEAAASSMIVTSYLRAREKKIVGRLPSPGALAMCPPK
jgi:hypothetical protein